MDFTRDLLIQDTYDREDTEADRRLDCLDELAFLAQVGQGPCPGCGGWHGAEGCSEFG